MKFNNFKKIFAPLAVGLILATQFNSGFAQTTDNTKTESVSVEINEILDKWKKSLSPEQFKKITFDVYKGVLLASQNNQKDFPESAKLLNIAKVVAHHDKTDLSCHPSALKFVTDFNNVTLGVLQKLDSQMQQNTKTQPVFNPELVKNNIEVVRKSSSNFDQCMKQSPKI